MEEEEDVEAIMKKLNLQGDIAVDWNDEDAEDPELLEELLALGGGVEEKEETVKEKKEDTLVKKEDTLVKKEDKKAVEISKIEQEQEHHEDDIENEDIRQDENENHGGEIENQDIHQNEIPVSHQNEVENPLVQDSHPSENISSETDDDNALPMEEKLKGKNIGILEKYVRLEQVKAVQFKKAGDKTQALKCLADSKLLQQRITQLKSTQTATKIVVQRTTQELPPSNSSFSFLTNKLKAQIASVGHDYVEQSKADLAYLAVLEAKNENPPLFSTVTVNVEKTFTNIALNELQVEISNCQGFYVDGALSSPFIHIELPYPSTQTFDSAVFRSPSDRTRAFQRFVERRKVTIEAFHYKGFLRKSVSLGKAQVTLSDLCKSCEQKCTVELVNESRKKTGATVDVAVRLRQPLVGKEIVAESFVVLNRDGVEGKIKPPLKTSPVKAISPKGVTAISPNASTTTAQKAVKSSSPVATKSSSPSKQQSVEEDEEIFQIEYFVSNNAMEKEIERINILSQQFEKQKQPIPFYLLDRKSMLEIQLMVLVNRVQGGLLSVPEYMAIIEDSIKLHHKKAVEYKNMNQIEHAKIMLQRAKVMQAELAECRQME